jgi:hypothetical protein
MANLTVIDAGMFYIVNLNTSFGRWSTIGPTHYRTRVYAYCFDTVSAENRNSTKAGDYLMPLLSATSGH